MNIRFLLPVWVALLLAACARPVAPDGGPKDTQPPRVDSLHSTPNLSTRFNPRRIELSFDEWVVLKDVNTQVVVSPPLAKRPDITLKGHTVTVELDKAEALRPNTTYTINFGNAIQDLHEGNAAKDLRFVFSTGDFIDSLSLAGRVSDAYSGDLIDNAAVMLYDNFADSALQKERPYYFARSDKSGQFLIQNVKAGTFRCVAVEDLDNNLRWNPATERIGFPDTLLTLNDSTKLFLQLKISKQPPRQRLIERAATRYGRIKLVYATPPDSLPTPLADTAGIRLLTERRVDSFYVWYDRPVAGGPWNLLVGPDTVAVKSLSREDFLKSHRVSWGDVNAIPGGRRKPSQPETAATAPAKVVSVNPFRSVTMPFSTPPAAFDTALWVLMLDSVRVRNFSIAPDSSSVRQLVLSTPWQSGKTYQLILLPGAVTDFYGVANADTLPRTFLVVSDKQLGSLALNFKNLQRDTPYFVQILDGNNVDQERRFTPESADLRIAFPNLQAVTYTVRLVEDRNGNGRWDAGSFSERRQPEPVFTRKLEALRANWEVEVEMDLAEKDKKKKG